MGTTDGKPRNGFVKLPAQKPAAVGECCGVRFADDGEGRRWDRLADLDKDHADAIRKRVNRHHADKVRYFLVAGSGGIQRTAYIANEAIVEALDGYMPPASAEALRDAVAAAPPVVSEEPMQTRTKGLRTRVIRKSGRACR